MSIEAQAECGCTGWVAVQAGYPVFLTARSCKEHEPGRRYGVRFQLAGGVATPEPAS